MQKTQCSHQSIKIQLQVTKHISKYTHSWKKRKKEEEQEEEEENDDET